MNAIDPDSSSAVDPGVLTTVASSGSRRRFIKTVGTFTISLAVIDGLIPLVVASTPPADPNCGGDDWGYGVTADADCGKTTDVDFRDGDCGLASGIFGSATHEDNDCVALPPGSTTPMDDSDCGQLGGKSPFGTDMPWSDEDCQLPGYGATEGKATGSAGADDDCGKIGEPYGGLVPTHSDSDCPPHASGQPNNTNDDTR